MYLIDTRKYDDSFLLAKILEKVDITDEEKKKLFKHFEKPEVVDAEPVRHGRWILQTNGHGMCSTCGTFVDLLNGMTWEYCPHCGAKMDEEI